jgi:hypothetical protein
MWGTTYHNNYNSSTQAMLDANNFRGKFGYYNSGSAYYSYGVYYDEDSILRMAGAYFYIGRGTLYYGTEYNDTYSTLYQDKSVGYYLVRAEPGDNLYSINDPLYDASKNIVPGGPSVDVPAPWVSMLAGVPLLLAWRRQRKNGESLGGAQVLQYGK